VILLEPRFGSAQRMGDPTEVISKTDISGRRRRRLAESELKVPRVTCSRLAYGARKMIPRNGGLGNTPPVWEEICAQVSEVFDIHEGDLKRGVWFAQFVPQNRLRGEPNPDRLRVKVFVFQFSPVKSTVPRHENPKRLMLMDRIDCFFFRDSVIDCVKKRVTQELSDFLCLSLKNLSFFPAESVINDQEHGPVGRFHLSESLTEKSETVKSV